MVEQLVLTREDGSEMRLTHGDYMFIHEQGIEFNDRDLYGEIEEGHRLKTLGVRRVVTKIEDAEVPFKFSETEGDAEVTLILRKVYLEKIEEETKDVK